MNRLEDQFDIAKLSAEERFIQETIYDCEYIKPDADNAIDYSNVMLDDVYYPIHLSNEYGDYWRMWFSYARFGQAESVEPRGFKMRSGMSPAFGSGEISYDIDNYKYAIAVLSQKEALTEKIKNESIRSIILGVPGSGKSMFCARLALACAKKEFGIERFAVLLKCRNLRNKMINCSNCFEHIAYEMSSTGLNTKEFITLMSNHAENGDLSLIIDGFDELNRQNKTIVFQALRDYLNKEDHSHINMIMTGRIQDYEEEIVDIINSINDISFHYIQRMTKNDKYFFIRQWSFNLNEKKEEDYSFVFDALDEIELGTEEIIKDLSEIPLYLSNLLEIKRAEGHIPQNMVKYNESFLRKFERRVHTDDIPYDLIIKFIAYCMTFEDDNRKIVINSDELTLLIEKCYSIFTYHFNGFIGKNEAEHIINVLVNDMAIFRPAISHRGEDLGLQFMHLSIQELLAAKAIITHTTPDGSGAVEFFHNNYNRINNPKDNEMFYYLIAKDLLRLSDELRNRESREIEMQLIEEKCTLLLNDKIKEKMVVYYPRQVMMLYFETNRIYMDTIISIHPQFRVYIREIAMEKIQKTESEEEQNILYDILDQIEVREKADMLKGLIKDKIAFIKAVMNYLTEIKSLAVKYLQRVDDKDDHIMLNRFINRIDALNVYDVIHHKVYFLNSYAIHLIDDLAIINILLIERCDYNYEEDGNDEWDLRANSGKINLLTKYLEDFEKEEERMILFLNHHKKE